MERVENELRISFNEWFEQFCKDKDGNVMMLTVGDIWEAWLAGAKTGAKDGCKDGDITFVWVEGKKLRSLTELSKAEKEKLGEMSIRKESRFIKTNTINTLTRNKVVTYRQLMELSQLQLARMNGIAQGSIDSIIRDLRDKGLRLMMSYRDRLDEE